MAVPYFDKGDKLCQTDNFTTTSPNVVYTIFCPTLIINSFPFIVIETGTSPDLAPWITSSSILRARRENLSSLGLVGLLLSSTISQ